MIASDNLSSLGPERRENQRRSGIDRRFGERRALVRASAGRRTVFPMGRRIAERRAYQPAYQPA
jgi:hypothetical protein